MRMHRSLTTPILILMSLLPVAPAAAQTPTGAELDEAARILVSRYSARTILRDAELDLAQAAALTADWPTDLKLALALSSAPGQQLDQHLGSVATRLPGLSARLKNDLFVESWLRNRVAEIRDANLRRSGEAIELRLNESAAARARGALLARARVRMTLGDDLAAFDQALRAAVRTQLAKHPDLLPALATPLDSVAILDSRGRLTTALTEAENRLKP